LFDWAVTVDGNMMPVDRDTAGKPGGNLAVTRVTDRGDGHSELRCRVLGDGEQPGPAEKVAWPHWAVCSNPPKRKRDRQ